MMEFALMALLCIALGAGAVLWIARAAPQRDLRALRTDVQVMTERLAGETSGLAARMDGMDHRMSASQTASSSMARDIFERLAEVRAATATVAEQAREFAALGDLLKTPQARGTLGEAMLEELLRQVLPPASYEMQHRFATGAVVDAIVRAGGRIVCIDAKFPLDNYRRMRDATDDLARAGAERAFAGDVDRHVADISRRYILPDQGTLDFAVMYIPAEGLYGEVLRLEHRDRPLFEKAIAARVVPMSPLTLYGYLQTILFGLKCLNIERNAEAVLDRCGRLQHDLEQFAADYEVVGRHLGNAHARYDDGRRQLSRLRRELTDVTILDQEGSEVRPLDAVNDG